MRRIYMKKSCPKMVYVDLHHRKVTSENLCRTMQHRSCLTGSSFKTHWLIKIKAFSIVIELEGAQQKSISAISLFETTVRPVDFT